MDGYGTPCYIRPKNICVVQVSRPYLGFCHDPQYFIVKYEHNLSNMLENGGICSEKCSFHIKYFDKIQCYADRPYLTFSELKPEPHIYFLGLNTKFK